MVVSESADAPAKRFAPFAASVTECTARLPTLVTTCGRGAEFERAVASVEAIESDCDEAGLDIAEALAGPLEPAFDRVYLQNADLLSLVRQYDDVASLAERFAKELAAVSPDLPDAVRTNLLQIARMAHDAAVCLERAIVAFVDSLADGSGPSIDAEVGRIRRLEDACDDAKYDCIAAAFDGASTAEALVYKDLATGLDAVVNAAEDTADHLVYTASKSV